MEEAEDIKQEETIEIWDNSKRAKSLIIVFGILIVITVIAVFSNYLELEILMKTKSGVFLDERETTINDLRQGIVALLQLGFYMASIVVFLKWFRRAYGNLHRLNVDVKHTERMALWYWIIPILCLYRPVQIMNEIWKKTQEKIVQYDSSYLIKNAGLLIGLWWTLFIISNFIGRYLLRAAFKQETINQLIDSSEATIISDIIQIAEALLIILIVHKLSKIELKLAEEVEKSGGTILYK